LLDNSPAGVQGSGMDEPTFDGFDVKFCRLIVEQLVGLRETIDAQSALLRTLAQQQERIIDVLKAVCDDVEGTDDPYGLFKDVRDDDDAGTPADGGRRRD
jgi:hypothetical protein